MIVATSAASPASAGRCIAVRDNEDAAAAFTVPHPMREAARLRARPVASPASAAACSRGIDGAASTPTLLRRRRTRCGSWRWAVIGGLGTGRRRRARRRCGSSACPPSSPATTWCPLLASGVGLLDPAALLPGRPGPARATTSREPRRTAGGRRREPARAEADRQRPSAAGTHRSARRADRPAASCARRCRSVRFGGTIAVDDVSHRRSHRGEIVGLIGTNGAGKSTLHERDRRLRARPTDDRASSGTTSTGVSARTDERGSDSAAPSRTPRSSRRPDGPRDGAWSRSRRGTASQPACRRRSRCRRAGRDERRKRAEADEIIAFLGLGALRRRARRRAVDRHAPHRRARRACSRSTPRLLLPRRTDRRRRPTRDRGLRPAAPRDPARARRVRCCIIEHDMPLDHVDQRPGLLPRSRPGDRRGHARRGAQRPRS